MNGPEVSFLPSQDKEDLILATPLLEVLEAVEDGDSYRGVIPECAVLKPGVSKGVVWVSPSRASQLTSEMTEEHPRQ